MADARLMIVVVGAPKRRNLAEEIGAFVGEFRRAQPVDRIRARISGGSPVILSPISLMAWSQLIAGPLAVDELHRVFEPAVAVHEFAHRGAFGAMRAAVDRAVPTRLLADPHAVGHFGGDGAADRAMRADAFADGHRGAWRGRRAGLGLTHAGERQRAERRETAGGQTGAAQESAAIEPSIRIDRRRRPSEPRLCLDVLFS